MLQLETLGYVFNESLRLWSRPDYPGIDYSDGDAAEQRLARIVGSANDLSTFSSELRNQCLDWLTIYHLSSQRGNVLRPFERQLKGRVLEIGAGCGAISRFLGENGGQILALEGSPRRAAIAASRTRDLENITVLAERFDDFHCGEQFDAITLIGVLEYASMFSTGDTPALNMLSKVRQLLKPDGHLFIAIENQLGLKYFAGAPEDHLGVAMYGIEGRYRPGQPQTFGRHALAELVGRAGFSTLEFLAPFPDYKVPRSIITERGSREPGFDAAALAWQNLRTDPQLPASTHFNLQRTWPTVFDNDLGIDLANSFIVVASPGARGAVDEEVLAYHYTTDRNAPFCKEATFVREQSGKTRVRYRKLSEQANVIAEAPFRFELPAEDDYRVGRLLSQDFFERLAAPDWTIEQIASLIRDYLRHLETLLEQLGEASHLNHSKAQLPGRFIDALPHNIVLTDEGVPQLFDIEWVAQDGVELGHILCRGLLLLIGQANNLAPPDGILEISRQQLVERLLEAAGVPLGEGDFQRYLAQESAFVRSVLGLPETIQDIWRSDELLTTPSKRQTCVYYCASAESFDEIRSARHALRDGRQQVRLHLHAADNDIGQLRFDPVAEPGWFILHEVNIRTPDGQDLWRLSEQDQAPYSWGIHQVAGAQPDQWLYYAVNDDPQMTLPVPEGQRSLVIDVDIELLGEERIVDRLRAANHRIGAVEHQLSQAEALKAGVEQQKAQLERQAAELNERYQRVLGENEAIKASRTFKALQKVARVKNLVRARPVSK
ncbi:MULTISPECIES: methyltransferase [Pseudomonas]|jgi:SAM-dependent methyltransferase|uniref:methyltransferase n=1 Tax=Pseudomonas TaxID=286 RepID=UPI000689AF32|nr:MULTISPECIES: methyltransferase [Pseudomonas]KWR74839.1 hypothetical protein RN02_24535 [Pseudomonas sp. PI1]WAB93658.1 methyltransferase [Pseudomonas citronellolis]